MAILPDAPEASQQRKLLSHRATKWLKSGNRNSSLETSSNGTTYEYGHAIWFFNSMALAFTIHWNTGTVQKQVGTGNFGLWTQLLGLAGWPQKYIHCKNFWGLSWASEKYRLCSRISTLFGPFSAAQPWPWIEHMWLLWNIKPFPKIFYESWLAVGQQEMVIFESQIQFKTYCIF